MTSKEETPPADAGRGLSERLGLVPERAEVAARLAEAWARHLGADPSHFAPTARLVADLHFDDLDCVDALMAAEDEFDLVIEDADAASCTTVDEYVTLVMRRIETPACANYEPPNVGVEPVTPATEER